MRRADRLFRLVELLRSRRLSTGAWLAGRLDVSLRTLYRDIADLSRSGVPIEGEAGVGYRLRHKLDLPPLLFDSDEIEALMIGSRMVGAWADPELARAATAAMAKIRNVLPAALRQESELARLFIPDYAYPRPRWLGELRLAVRGRKVVRIEYRREDGAASQRELWPLGLFFWGPAWMLLGWCRLREDFRNFRVDRIAALTVLPEPFPDQPGRRLGDYFVRLKKDRGAELRRAVE